MASSRGIYHVEHILNIIAMDVLAHGSHTCRQCVYLKGVSGWPPLTSAATLGPGPIYIHRSVPGKQLVPGVLEAGSTPLQPSLNHVTQSTHDA